MAFKLAFYYMLMRLGIGFMVGNTGNLGDGIAMTPDGVRRVGGVVHLVPQRLGDDLTHEC